MKTQTKQSKIIVLMSAVILLLVALSATLTYAYFTSSANLSGDDLQFGELALSSENMQIAKVSQVDEELVPGDTINLSGSISLNGNIEAFVRTKVEVFIAKKVEIATNASADETYTVAKTPVNDATAVYVKSADESKDLVKLGNKYYELQSQANKTGAGTSKAEIIFGKLNAAMSTASDGTWLSYTDGYLYYDSAVTASADGTDVITFDGNSINLEANAFGNDWQGLFLVVSVSAQAIQADHLTCATDGNSVAANDQFALVAGDNKKAVAVLADVTAWTANMDTGIIA